LELPAVFNIQLTFNGRSKFLSVACKAFAPRRPRSPLVRNNLQVPVVMPNQKQQTAELETAGGTPTRTPTAPGASAKAAKAPRAPRAPTAPTAPTAPRAPSASKPAAKATKAQKPEGAAPKTAKKASDSGAPKTAKTAKTPGKRTVKPASETSSADAEPHGFHENPVVTYEMIAVRAYFLAENRQSNGHPGDHDANWLEAERQLQEESTSIPSSLRKAR